LRENFIESFSMGLRGKSLIFCLAAVVVAAATYWIGGRTGGSDSFDTPEAAARLGLLVGPTDCPPRLEGSTLVGGCDRRPFPRAPHLTGSIDILGVSVGRLTVVGWAGDTAWFRPARAVLIVLDDQARLWARVGEDRPDVGTHFGRESMRSTGYVLRVPAEQSEAILQRLRIFAVGPDGAVAELKSGAHTRRE
jgi:hypothetical protein